MPRKHTFSCALQVVLALLLSCSAAAGTSLDDVAEKGAVQVLTSASWASFLSDLTKPLVVLHYAPWCGHCKRLLPDYEVASRRCASVAVFSKVDCTTQSGLCTGVSGYPHLKIHLRDSSSWSEREYDGETTVEALEMLCNRIASPKFTTIPDAVALKKQSAAFAIDSRAGASEMSLFHSAANDFYHVSRPAPPSAPPPSHIYMHNALGRSFLFSWPEVFSTSRRALPVPNSPTPAAYLP
jgi:thiol-disulfide isomerase/thioredoxin